MQGRTTSQGKIDLSIGNGNRYIYSAVVLVALISLLDFRDIPLETVRAIISFFSQSTAETFVRFAQDRAAPAHAAITLASSIAVAWLGFIYFVFSIPGGMMREKYLLERKAWNYLGLIIGCALFQSGSSIFLHLPVLKEFSARPDGVYGRKLEFLIQTDTGLGMLMALALTMTAYTYATLLKTVYAHLSTANQPV